MVDLCRLLLNSVAVPEVVVDGEEGYVVNPG
jgi:hypothetical protein